MRFKIYFEKPVNSNPYYASNKELNNLSKIINELNKNKTLKDKLIYTGIIGGQRNQSPFECEINLIVKDNDKATITLATNNLRELTEKYGGKYLIDEVKIC